MDIENKYEPINRAKRSNSLARWFVREYLENISINNWWSNRRKTFDLYTIVVADRRNSLLLNSCDLVFRDYQLPLLAGLGWLRVRLTQLLVWALGGILLISIGRAALLRVINCGQAGAFHIFSWILSRVVILCPFARVMRHCRWGLCTYLLLLRCLLHLLFQLFDSCLDPRVPKGVLRCHSLIRFPL